MVMTTTATRTMPGNEQHPALFVRGIVQGGQAEALGVVEVGDRLQGVGELHLGEGGFEKAVAMVRNNTLVVVCAALSF